MIGKKINGLQFLVPIYLFLLVFTAFFLRSWQVKEKLFFGPEQGIDALVSYRMINDGKFTLIGPKTDIAGIFHGPLFYYISTFFYYLFQGNPVLVLNAFILLHALTIFLLYKLVKDLFDRRTAFISVLLYTFSYGAIAYSRWLSTHILVFPLSVLFIWFYQKAFLKKQEWFVIPLAIIFGLISQAFFLNLLFFSFILLVGFFLFKLEIKNKFYWLIGILLAIGFSVGHFIIFDLRHNFLIFNSFLKLLTGKRGFAVALTDVLRGVFRTYLEEFTFLFTFQQLLVGSTLFIITIIILIMQRKKSNIKLLLLWIFIPPFLLIFFRHSPLSHFFVAVLMGMIIAVAYVFARLKKLGLIFLSFIFVYNLWLWYAFLPTNRGMFFQAPQPKMNLADQKKIIDFVYQTAKGEPFFFQAYTIPYYMPQGWQYLFLWYGKSQYRYLPLKERQNLLYAIYQEDTANQIFLDAWIGTLGKNKIKTDEAKFGILGVERYENKRNL